MKKRFGKKRAAQLAGLRFQGRYFPLATLRNVVKPPAVARLGEVAIAAFLVLHERSVKYGNPVWVGFDTLRAMAGGKTDGAIRLPRTTLQRALRKLTVTEFLSTPGAAHRGKNQRRSVLVQVKRNGGTLEFTLPVRARLGLDDLDAWGGPKMGPFPPSKMRPFPPQDEALSHPKMEPFDGARLGPFDSDEESDANPAEEVVEQGARLGPFPEQDEARSNTGTDTLEEATSREDHLLLTEKSVSAAGAAEIFSSVPPPPSPPRAVLALVPPMPATPPAELDPDDTPGFSPGQPQLWKGKPQIGPMPADFREAYGKFAHLYWGKPQTAGPVRYGINGMPTRPPTGCVMYTLPAPPRVPAKYGDGDEGREPKLKFMLKWYRVALRSRGIEPPRNVGLKGKSLKWFEDALDIFEEHDISPGAWVAFSLDRVLLPMPPNARKRYVPQLKVLFSPKALVDNRWQFRNMEADYTTPQLVFSPKGKEHYARFTAMERDVLRSLDRSERAITAIVKRHFPEGYSTALKISQENSRSCEQEVLAQIDRGNWLWPLPSGLKPKKRAG